MSAILRLRSFLTGLAAVLLPALPALAGGGEEKNEAGLPQLDTALFPEQLFWLVISFAVLYWLMARVALPNIQKTQENRSETITNDLAAARAVNQRAQNMIAHYEKTLLEARAEAQATVTEITAQAAREAAEMEASQLREIGKRLQETEAQVLAAREAAMKNIHAVAVDLGVSLAEKITGTKLSAGVTGGQ